MPVVLCYGDSNTHGSMPMSGPEGAGRYSRDMRWPGVAAATLGPDWQVIEEGLGGRTTVHEDVVEGGARNGLAVLPAALHSHKPLDVVVLMLGTNDLKLRFSVTAQDIANSCGRLITCIRDQRLDPDPAVLLVCPPPIVETGYLGAMFAGGAEKSRALAPAIRALAGFHGVAFYDAAEVATVDPLDGIHYSADTHTALGAAMALQIERLGQQRLRN